MSNRLDLNCAGLICQSCPIEYFEMHGDRIQETKSPCEEMREEGWTLREYLHGVISVSEANIKIAKEILKEYGDKG